MVYTISAIKIRLIFLANCCNVCGTGSTQKLSNVILQTQQLELLQWNSLISEEWSGHFHRGKQEHIQENKLRQSEMLTIYNDKDISMYVYIYKSKV